MGSVNFASHTCNCYSHAQLWDAFFLFEVACAPAPVFYSTVVGHRVLLWQPDKCNMLTNRKYENARLDHQNLTANLNQGKHMRNSVMKVCVVWICACTYELTLTIDSQQSVHIFIQIISFLETYKHILPEKAPKAARPASLPTAANRPSFLTQKWFSRTRSAYCASLRCSPAATFFGTRMERPPWKTYRWLGKRMETNWGTWQSGKYSMHGLYGWWDLFGGSRGGLWWRPMPIGSMGLIYFPTFKSYKSTECRYNITYMYMDPLGCVYLRSNPPPRIPSHHQDDMNHFLAFENPNQNQPFHLWRGWHPGAPGWEIDLSDTLPEN